MKRAIIFSGDLHNVGDLALLLQTAHGLRYHLGLEEIWVRQWVRPDASVMRQLAEHRIRLLAGKKMLDAVRLLPGALLMFGGGQMVRDNTSLASTGSIATLMFLARVAGGKSAAIGCGVSRVEKPAHQRLWTFMLKQMDLFAVRDESSLKAVQAFNTGIPAHLTADLIHLPSPIGERLKTPDPAELIVIGPCEDLSENRTFSAELIERLVLKKRAADGPLEVVILCHDSRPGMDPVVAERVKAALADHGISAHIHKSYDLQSFIAYYRRARLVVTNRLHSIFFAALAEREIILVDDGNSKTRSAAGLLDLAVVSADSDDAAIDAALAKAVENRVSARRQKTLGEWTVAAVRNFTLLQDLVRKSK